MGDLIALALVAALSLGFGLALQRGFALRGDAAVSNPQAAPFLGGGGMPTHAWQRYHEGVAVAGALTGGESAARHLALTGAVVEMVAHGLVTGALFLVCGAIWQRAETYELDAFGGLAGVAPRLAVATTLGIALVVVGIGLKLGAVPAHAWLPDVAEGSPAPAAAFLTVVPKVGAAIALARLLGVFDDGTGWRTLVAAIAIATMTLGNLAALWQTDVRRLLGWSSVSQSGYALMAITVTGLDKNALPALLVFLAGYAAANLAAFAVVTQLRGRTALDDFHGLAAARPVIAAVLTLSLLSLVGIPPLAGFVGKLMLFVTTIGAGYAALAVVALLNTVVSLFYYLRVLAPMYFAPSKGPVELLGPGAYGAVVVGGVAIVAVGLGAGALLTRFEATTLLP